MKKLIDTNTVIFTGLVTMGLMLAMSVITIYFGIRAGGQVTEVIAVIFREMKIQMSFLIANLILIALLCLNLVSHKIYKEYIIPYLSCSASMLILSLIFIPKNFIAIFTAIFWTFTVVHLYQTRKEINTMNAHLTSGSTADRD